MNKPMSMDELKLKIDAVSESVSDLRSRLPAPVDELKRRVGERVSASEAEARERGFEAEARERGFEARPLPPTTVDESREALLKILDAAELRQLSAEEVFLASQLISNLEMGVRAETLGKKGRYFVISEEQVMRQAEKLMGGGA